MKERSRFTRGFTIVELLIVIVVLGILAAITIVAYNGIQQRARDTTRKSDIATITKALEYYYQINDKYPPSAGGSTVINSGWSTTADASWQYLVNILVPTYVSSLPKDPSNSSGRAAISGGSAYDYLAISGYCAVSGARQGYLLAYHLEGSAQVNTLKGDCPSSPIGPYGAASNYRVIK